MENVGKLFLDYIIKYFVISPLYHFHHFLMCLKYGNIIIIIIMRIIIINSVDIFLGAVYSVQTMFPYGSMSEY